MTPFLLSILVLSFILSVRALDAKSKPKTPCKRHTWSYDSTGRMFCDVCKNSPFNGGLA